MNLKLRNRFKRLERDIWAAKCKPKFSNGDKVVFWDPFLGAGTVESSYPFTREEKKTYCIHGYKYFVRLINEKGTIDIDGIKLFSSTEVIQVLSFITDKSE